MGRHQPLFQAPGDLDSAEHVFVALVKIQQRTIAGNLKCKQVTYKHEHRTGHGGRPKTPTILEQVHSQV